MNFSSKVRNYFKKIQIASILLISLLYSIPSFSYACNLTEGGSTSCFMPSSNFCPGSYLTKGTTIMTYGYQNLPLITFTAPEDGYYYYGEYSWDDHFISINCSNPNDCWEYWDHCEISNFPSALSSDNGCFQELIGTLSGADTDSSHSPGDCWEESIAVSQWIYKSEPSRCAQGDCCSNVSFGSSANYSSGNLYETRDIIASNGKGLNISLPLSYNSLDKTIGPFGRGWTHNYNLKIIQPSNSILLLMTEDGKRVYFGDDGTGIYRPMQSTEEDRSTIIINEGEYQLTRRDKKIYCFNSVSGQLLSIIDRNNNTTTLSYANDSLTSISDPYGRTTGITYDAQSRITSIADPANRITHITYDGNGYLSTITDPASNAWHYTYNAGGKMLTKTDPMGNITTYAYDAQGRVTTSVNPSGTKSIAYMTGNTVTITERDGGVWTYKYDATLSKPLEVTAPNNAKTINVYDADGNLLSQTDPNGHTTSYIYDDNGNMTSMTDTMGNIAIYTYNEFGQTTSITDPHGNITTYMYDANGNLISTTDPSGIITQYQHDLRGNVISINNAGKILSLAYDQYNNLISLTDPSGAITSFTYDISGNMTSQTDAIGNTTTFKYNISNQLIRASDPHGNITTYTYDAMSNRILATDANGNVTSYEYNHNNQPLTVIDALGNRTTYTYGSVGCPSCSGGADKLTSVTDANNHTISYDYDLAGRLCQMTDQLENIETHTYDSNNNLITVTDRKGQTKTYTYDSLNRITKATYADGSFTTYAYDVTGKVTTITDSISGTISYTYSTANSSMPTGKVINETTPLGSISYTYDSWGRRTTMTVTGQLAVNYTYDDNGHLTGIDTPMNGAISYFSIQYDALGRRTSLTLPNGATANYSYDNLSNLLNLQHLNPLQTVLESIGYTYDPVGNRLSMDRPSVNLPRPNPASNITYNSANQMLTFNAENITYDANGNMTAVTNFCGTTTYTWDVRNRLKGINGYKPDCTALTAFFEYDALGRRIEKTINGMTIQYLYDGRDIVQEIENGTATVNYIRTLNIDEPLARVEPNGTVRYYQTDALGSIIALTDETGAIRTRYVYNSFGNVTILEEISNNPFQYTGRENDGTGLYYYRARYYSPEKQRFISEDPIGLAGGIHLYAYVENNPIINIDPSGLAYFAKRSLWILPWLGPLSCNPSSIDDNLNTEISHEHLFFEDGKQPSNVGCSSKGLFTETNPKNYQCHSGKFDDCIMRKAYKNVPCQYSLIKSNCQDWANGVRMEYNRLAADSQVRKECECKK